MDLLERGNDTNGYLHVFRTQIPGEPRWFFSSNTVQTPLEYSMGELYGPVRARGHTSHLHTSHIPYATSGARTPSSSRAQWYTSPSYSPRSPSPDSSGITRTPSPVIFEFPESTTSTPDTEALHISADVEEVDPNPMSHTVPHAWTGHRLYYFMHAVCIHV